MKIKLFHEKIGKAIRKVSGMVVIPEAIYLFKVDSRNTRRNCEACSELTVQLSQRCQSPFSGAFNFDFEEIQIIS